MMRENPDPKSMFLKQVRPQELETLKGVQGGVQVRPLIRKGKEATPDMQLVIDAAQRMDKAGEIGLKLPTWSNVEFTTSPPRLVIDLPDSDDEDLCNRNSGNPARLAFRNLDPKLLDSTSPFVDGLISTDGRALSIRAIYNKESQPSNCPPEIEMLGLGNWNVISPNPALDINDFQSSAKYRVNMGSLRKDGSVYLSDMLKIQKESIEDQVALQPLDSPNMDLAFNFGKDLSPETRWTFSAKCQKGTSKGSVPLSEYIQPNYPAKVQAIPRVFGVPQIKSIHDTNWETKERMKTLFYQHIERTTERPEKNNLTGPIESFYLHTNKDRNKESRKPEAITEPTNPNAFIAESQPTSQPNTRDEIKKLIDQHLDKEKAINEKNTLMKSLDSLYEELIAEKKEDDKRSQFGYKADTRDFQALRPPNDATNLLRPHEREVPPLAESNQNARERMKSLIQQQIEKEKEKNSRQTLLENVYNDLLKSLKENKEPNAVQATDQSHQDQKTYQSIDSNNLNALYNEMKKLETAQNEIPSNQENIEKDVTRNEIGKVAEDSKLPQDSLKTVGIKEYLDLLQSLNDIVEGNETILEKLAGDESRALALKDATDTVQTSITNIDVGHIIIQFILEIIAKIQHVFISLLFKDTEKETVSQESKTEHGENLLERYFKVLNRILKMTLDCQSILRYCFLVQMDPKNTEKLNKQVLFLSYCILDSILGILSGIQGASGIATPPEISFLTSDKGSRANKDLATKNRGLVDFINSNHSRLENIKNNFEKHCLDQLNSKENVPQKALKHQGILETTELQEHHSFILNVLEIVKSIQKMFQDTLINELASLSRMEYKMSGKQPLRGCHLTIHGILNISSYVQSIFEDLNRHQVHSSVTMTPKSTEKHLKEAQMYLQNIEENIEKEKQALEYIYPGALTRQSCIWESCFIENGTEVPRSKEISLVIRHFTEMHRSMGELANKAYQQHSIPHYEFQKHDTRHYCKDHKNFDNINQFNNLVCQVLEDAFKEQTIIEETIYMKERLKNASKRDRHGTMTSKDDSNMKQLINESMLDITTKVQELISETSINMILASPKSPRTPEQSPETVLATIRPESSPIDSQNIATIPESRSNEPEASIPAKAQSQNPPRFFMDPFYRKKKRCAILSDLFPTCFLKTSSVSDAPSSHSGASTSDQASKVSLESSKITDSQVTKDKLREATENALKKHSQKMALP